MTSSNKRELPLEQLMPLIREQLKNGQSVRFSPRGTSMLPLLRQGKDRVVLSPLPEKLKKYDIILYQRENGAYVLHRIIGVKNGKYTCLGDHQFTPEPGIDPETVIAVVSSFYRKQKKHSVNAVSYRLYCVFWSATRSIRYLFAVGFHRLNQLFSR